MLRTTRLAVGLWTKDAPVSLVHCAQQIAVGLRVYKLVYLDPNGGLVRDGHRLSCLTEPGLHDLLRRGARRPQNSQHVVRCLKPFMPPWPAA